MLTLRSATLVGVLASYAGVLHAQTDAAAPPTTPRGCLIAAQKYENDMYQAARTAGTPINGKAWHAQAIVQAKQCSMQFNVETINPAQRPVLGFLYMAVDNVAQGKLVLARVERELPVDANMRANVLLQLMQAYGGNSDPQAALTDCVRLVQRLDTVPGVHAQKLTAHGVLLSLANNADLDDLARDNVAAVLALVPQLTPDEQRDNAKVILNAYETRAVHQANALHADSALLTLAAAPSALPGIPSAADKLAHEMQRYAMIGKPGPALHADYWINKQALPLHGPATVLVFTAHWCHSCHTSYPALTSAMNAYPSSRLQTVFSVNLDGQFQGVSMSPVEELNANRKYFVTEHKFANSIAVQRNASGKMPAPLATSNGDAYVMNYLPQVVIIDQHGIVRAVLQGWDAAGNRERAFRAALEQILGKVAAL